MEILRTVKDWPISQSFLNYSGGVQALLIGMPICGIISVIVGWHTDLRADDWSQSLGFLTNIWAGLTGFLIGVPLALVVLATITAQREDKAARDRVQDISIIAWEQFRDAVYELCSEARHDAMEECAKQIQGIHDQIIAGVMNYATDPDRSEDSFHGMIDFLEHERQLWGVAFSDVAQRVGNSFELQWMWIGVVRDWNTIDQYVRLQRLEQKLPPLERKYDNALQQQMDRTLHPMRDFFDAHEGPSPESNLWTNSSMLAGLRSLDDLTSGLHSNHEALQKALAERRGYFPDKRVDGYYAAVDQAQFRMRSLLYLVQEIDREICWPKNFDRPEEKSKAANNDS